MDLPLALMQRIEWLGGYCVLSDVLECGGCSQDVVAWRREGLLRRMGRGAYVLEERFRSADLVEQRWLWASAVTRHRTCGTPLVASAETALWVWRAPTLLKATSTVVLARTGDGPSETRRGEQIQKTWGPASITSCGNTPVVVPAVAAVSHAARWGVEAGVVAMDALLQSGAMTQLDLRHVLGNSAGRPGMRAARRAVAMADGRAESPGESLLRLALIGLGLHNEPQTWVDTDVGRFRADFSIPELAAIAEFDGAVKYEGRDGKRALTAEKRREDAIRRAGFRVIRVTWADLQEPGRLPWLSGRCDNTSR